MPPAATAEGLTMTTPATPPPCRRLVAPGDAPHRVVLLDTPDHTFEFAVRVLGDAIGYTPDEAAGLAAAAHFGGRATVAVAGRAVAEAIRDRIRAAGPDPTLRHSHGPLAIVVEPGE